MPETTAIPGASSSALPPGSEPARPSALVRAVTVLVVSLPFLAALAAPFVAWGWGFGWTDFGLLVGLYVVTMLGVTAGFHRLFVHRSFETFTWMKALFAILGSMAVQGSLFKWVGMHRRHHRYSDTPDDPHTPVHHGPGLGGLLRGFWHAHIGWFFDPDPADLDRYVLDLTQSPTLRAMDRLFLLWVFIGLALPAVLGGVITLSWAGALTGLIWGGLVRLFLVHHMTWSINSVCHLWGMRPYRSADASRNNVVMGVLAMGEGWHNSHHAFPNSARHGLRWWQLDVSWLLIRDLSRVGLAWNLKVPSRAAQERARAR